MTALGYMTYICLIATASVVGACEAAEEVRHAVPLHHDGRPQAERQRIERIPVKGFATEKIKNSVFRCQFHQHPSASYNEELLPVDLLHRTY